MIAIDERKGNIDKRVSVGDKILKVSASFGDDTWDALNFGQVVYAIKTRSGDVYLQMERRFGDLSPLEKEEADMAENMYRCALNMYRSRSSSGGGRDLTCCHPPPPPPL